MTDTKNKNKDSAISFRTARDEATYRSKLSSWLQQKLPGCRELEIKKTASPLSTGSSSELIFLDFSWRDADSSHDENYVIRLEPSSNVMHPDADFRKQYDYASAVYQTGNVPGPTMLGFESSTEIFGAPFCAMERIEGVAAGDSPPYNLEGWLADASPELRQTVWWEGIRAMTELHIIDIESNDFSAFRNADTARGELSHEIDYWASVYDHVCRGNRFKLVDEAFNWVRSNLPENEGFGLCWGDARLANMLFDPNTGQCVAMLDWEFYSLGAPEKDMAYWIVWDRFFTEGNDIPRLPGWPSYDETITEYERLSGYTLENMRFYEIFAQLRNIIGHTHAYNVYKESGRTHFLVKEIEDIFFARQLDELINS